MIRTLTVVLHVVRCDSCGHQPRIMADGYGDEERAVAEVLRLGWLVTSDEHLCPSCLRALTERERRG